MTRRRVHIAPLALVLMAWLFASCSADRYLGSDDRLLKQNRYEARMADGTPPTREVEEVLESAKKYTVQSPNKNLLGVRHKMRIYCTPAPADSGWFAKFMRREGEAPVIYDAHAAHATARQLQGLLESKGSFGSAVEFDTAWTGRRDVEVTYHITATPRYKIGDVRFSSLTPEIAQHLEEWSKESELKVGDWYDQDKISAERDRITSRLLNRGYYQASKDLVAFMVDTSYSDEELSIGVRVRGLTVYDSAGNASQAALSQYRINNIYIYPNRPQRGAGVKLDTVVYTQSRTSTLTRRSHSTDFRFVATGPMTLKPSVIAQSVFLNHGQLYRTSTVDRTYNALLNLRNFKYINIDFVESPESCDTARLLDARIRLLNSTRQRLSLSLEINNSSPMGSLQNGVANGNFGLETVLGYQNKNLFGGAEMLKVEGSFLVEMPKFILSDGVSEFHNTFSAFESGIDAQLDIPFMLFPGLRNATWQRTRPHTVFGLGFDYQYRSYFERVLFNTSAGYSWSNNANSQHQLLPIELTYVRFLNLDSAYLARMESISDLRLKYQYSDHFIMNTRYDYAFTNQQIGTRQNFNYLHMSVETAGNLCHALSHAFDGPADENGIRQFFGVAYSQYLRLNLDAKRYFYYAERRTFVARMLLGVGFPYTNSQVMPYEKSFFGGGPTTMRAWQLRRLGPGFYHNDGAGFERVGDMTFILNLEDRFPLFSVFEGALFADVGNVWLMRPSQEFPGGEFRADQFVQSLAVGTGLGLRLNISILTVRCDFGIPLYDPCQVAGQRWRLPQWRFNQIVTNLGIDYPF